MSEVPQINVPQFDENNNIVSQEQQEEPRFKIKKWTAVGIWSWDLDSADCAICKSNLMEPCVDCQNDAHQQHSNSSNPQNSMNNKDGCITATGTCGHSFHLHCITKWLQKRQVCPLDSQTWDFKKYNK
ncbi:hypothetical protein ACO0SA_004961 [Hanseniaspora valbyensis]|uniref:RING/U-box n=1 Tax=Hanseniaspora valbyensis NRRL Y-1626 TaxID=766949 RepID=A0A1B7T7S3_9ASCO|nr:RING/U-box [Hanseniaspora valbyensis NRRL Y-1626]